MVPMDRFMIAPLTGGLQTNLKPWLIPDDAFEQLRNAYVFRGRIIKRFGARLMEGASSGIVGFEQLTSRLAINIGTTAAITGNFSVTIPGAVLGVGIMFSVGNQIYTVYQTGNPAAMLNTGAGTATYSTTTGVITLTGAAPTTSVFYYPAQPVMGLVNYEQAGLSYEPIIAFDTQFAYQFTSTGWSRLGTAVWTGSDSQYFWGYNWRGSTSANTYLYVTNYNTAATLTGSDNMYYWNGAAWTSFQPGFTSTTATNTILSARIIIPFKDRLVLLNVVENTGVAPGTNATYVNRCRFSWNGDPTNAAAFYEDVAGSGGYIDAPTKEPIVTAQFLKDRLIVYFTQSTWELVYTGNQVLPFVWQQINTELGAEATFSQVPFDKAVLGIGNVGIHACNGSNVDRIDQNIPDSVFEIHLADSGPKRVYGIRDYFAETVYWAYPFANQGSTNPFSNQVLVYNYKTGAWAINDDSITAFGYYQATNAIEETWASSQQSWNSATYAWINAPLQAQFRNVIAGNQEGFVFIISSAGGEDTGASSTNSRSLQITNMVVTNATTVTITAINHNLSVGSFVKIQDAQGLTLLNGDIVKVATVINANSFTITVTGITGTYTGAGTLTRVTPPSIVTKQYNFYAQEGRNVYISKVDFLVTKTSSGQFTVDFATSSSDESLLQSGTGTGAIIGSSILETSPYGLMPQEQNQSRLWHPVYLLADGECVQLNLYLSDQQAMDPLIAESEFEIHAMTFYAQRTSSRLQ